MKWQTDKWQSNINTLYNKLLLSLGQCDLCGNNLTLLPADQGGKPTATMTQQTLICAACFADLPFFKQTIIQGDLLNWPAINKALPHIDFEHLICLAPYLPPFTQWLPQLKYQGRFELASLLSNLLAQLFIKAQLSEYIASIDLILSVPLHTNKWQTRGYNQAHLLAKPLASYLKIPYDATALMRVKNNISQVGQTGSQRRNNLAGAFQLTKGLTNTIKHVMLVDDVLTTGSTVNEISKVLKKAGVKQVTVMTVCLTLPKTSN